MIREARFSIYAPQDILDDIADHVKGDAVSCKNEFGELTIDVLENTSAYLYIRKRIQEEKIANDFNEFRQYTKKEIENAEFYDLTLLNPWESEGQTEKSFNVDYDMSNTCPQCGGGKRLRSDILVQTSKLKNKDIVLLIPSIIVSEKVKRLIEENCLTGCYFAPVRDYKRHTVEDYYHLVINNELPALNKSVRIIHVSPWYCEVCHNRGQILESEMIYRKTDLQYFKDLNVTKEHFGVATSMQKIVISKRVRDLFKKEKIRTAYYEPVHFLND